MTMTQEQGRAVKGREAFVSKAVAERERDEGLPKGWWGLWHDARGPARRVYRRLFGSERTPRRGDGDFGPWVAVVAGVRALHPSRSAAMRSAMLGHAEPTPAEVLARMKFASRVARDAERALGAPPYWWGTWRDLRGPGGERVFFSSGAWTAVMRDGSKSRHESRKYAIRKAARS